MFIYKKWDGKSSVGKLTDPDTVREHFGLDKDHVAYFVYDEAGSKAALPEILWGLISEKSLEKILEGVIRTKRKRGHGPSPFNDFYRTDIHYRRTGVLGKLRKRSRCCRENRACLGIRRRQRANHSGCTKPYSQAEKGPSE